MWSLVQCGVEMEKSDRGSCLMRTLLIFCICSCVNWVSLLNWQTSHQNTLNTLYLCPVREVITVLRFKTQCQSMLAGRRQNKSPIIHVSPNIIGCHSSPRSNMGVGFSSQVQRPTEILQGRVNVSFPAGLKSLMMTYLGSAHLHCKYQQRSKPLQLCHTHHGPVSEKLGSFL